MYKKNILLLLLLFVQLIATNAQQLVSGEVKDAATGIPLEGVSIQEATTNGNKTVTGVNGRFKLMLSANAVIVSAIGYQEKKLTMDSSFYSSILLVPDSQDLDAVVVSGTMKPVRKLESPVAVEVYSPAFFKKNPAPSIFESLQNVNGVRPQLNCSVCNTGDIHINGLEGPYTMVTIDGMPIVSSLSTVYGLYGIPTQLIDRIEIVKGPASGLYGSEAIGGLINIITKSPEKAPQLTGNIMATNWKEYSVDLGGKFKLNKNVSSLIGLNYFNYQSPIDKNNDLFTDITLQHRISVFNKISFQRKNNRLFNLAARYFYEDRWGGAMNWGKKFRGGDSLYGESIYTSRWEMIGHYQLPITNENMKLSFSATTHRQNAYYGTTAFMANQKIGFAQLIWDKQISSNHSLLSGLALRYNYYDDNSTATKDTLIDKNKPDQYMLPGVFLQDEWTLSPRHLLLVGLRYDYHKNHGSIFTPRLAWKWSLANNEVVRLNAGTGFRVVNIFTEEHAALTGARVVEIATKLKPEQSYNINLNYTKHLKWQANTLTIDAAIWYTYFTNQIIPDYESNSQKIIYTNLNGYAISKGATLNVAWNPGNRLKTLFGFTLQDVYKTEINNTGKKIHTRQMLTEKWSGTWSLGYTFPAIGISIDYTGNIYGPMKLPLLSGLDPRAAQSPVWSLQNIQFTKILGAKWEMYTGIKNLLNWTPAKSSPFLIARSHDPFNKKVEYDATGNPIATAENPYALTFDPAYVYAPNQGMRLFVGVRVTIK